MNKVYIQLGAGDRATHSEQVQAHTLTAKFLADNADAYGLSPDVTQLEDEGREILKEAFLTRNPGQAFQPFEPPPLTYPPLHITLSPAPGLSKTTSNFRSLCTGECGTMKKAPYKELCYQSCPVHRVQKGFVLQGGDITRGDGSGGVSVFGSALPLEKPGLKLPFSYGTLAMASSGPAKPGSSQFFICLTDDPVQLKKLEGKYVVFGQVDEGAGLEGLKALVRRWGTTEGSIKENAKVWIESCGAL